MRRRVDKLTLIAALCALLTCLVGKLLENKTGAQLSPGQGESAVVNGEPTVQSVRRPQTPPRDSGPPVPSLGVGAHP